MSCRLAPPWLCWGVAVVVGKGSTSPPHEETLSLTSAQRKWPVAKDASSRAAAVGKFGQSWWHVWSLTFPVVCADAQIWGRLELPGRSERPRWGQGGQQQVSHSCCRCAALAAALETPETCLAQRNNKYRGHFSTHLSFHLFFSCVSPALQKTQGALSLLGVKRNISFSILKLTL